VFFLQEELKILFTSDIHGHALPINYGSNTIEPIGLVKYAQVVKELKEKHEHVLVIDNGDLIQGTPLMTNYVKNHADSENPMIEVFNQLSIDAAVLGNHEFNFGKEMVSSAVEQANFPYLAANILDKATGKPAFGPTYLIKDFDPGFRVAILGVTTHYIPNWESTEHIRGLEFKDAFDTVQEWIPVINEKEKPDVVIVSYHGGFERDVITGEITEPITGENQGYQMCMEIPGIDILLTGHQHRKLTEVIDDVLVVQPGKNASHYGELSLILEADKKMEWNIVDKQAYLHSMEAVKNDEETFAYLQPLEDSTQKWLDQPIGYINGDMTIRDPFEARIKKHPFIQLIQDIQMDASGVDISVSSLLNNESSGFTSPVTMRDVVSNYMYPNTLVVLELTGKDIKAALEQTAAYFMLDSHHEITVNPAYIEPKPQHYNYDMWEGILYTLNISKPVGERLEDITYKGEAILDDKSYRVVLNNYRASGGGDYLMFQGKKVIQEIQIDAVELIQSYFETHRTIDAYTIDNFRVKK
jgi:2',3'-cyclic-nucleotide 2'-phosphodiesterase/3'-nucleotidase